jgi:hypothetical protein
MMFSLLRRLVVALERIAIALETQTPGDLRGVLDVIAKDPALHAQITGLLQPPRDPVPKRKP